MTSYFINSEIRSFESNIENLSPKDAKKLASGVEKE